MFWKTADQKVTNSDVAVADSDTTALETTSNSMRFNTSSREKLAHVEGLLLSRHVKSHFKRHLVRPKGRDWAINTLVINGPTDLDTSQIIDPNRKTLVLMHGYGSGLGFFYSNYDTLSQIRDSNGERIQIIAADWLGCGGSSRPRFAVRNSKAGVDSVNDATAVIAAEDYFVDAFEDWRQEINLEKFALVGHSLGGYLSAVYALKHAHRLFSLTLLSPFGLLSHPPDSAPLIVSEHANQLPFAQRLFLAAWKYNVTPQWILRGLGPYGPKMASRIVSRRFPTMDESEQHLISDYVYNLSTVRPAAGEYALNALMELRALSPAKSTTISPEIDKGNERRSSFGLFARNPVGLRMFKGLPEALPVTIIFGDNDWMFSNSRQILALDLIRARKASRLHILDNAGHHLYLDNPQQMYRTIEKSPLFDHK
ncbi:hypothetical protein HK100_007048 [Physocladia obscura]|uniref:AB hydrolase-1 domain-containing protein n=1 Tax=Physocladia obscura TaxID=109957 RepID=A0AAD5TC37_9FUNG|nr:hypothetical protein HK100_007048 [Physocladia obscura]